MGGRDNKIIGGCAVLVPGFLYLSCASESASPADGAALDAPGGESIQLLEGQIIDDSRDRTLSFYAYFPLYTTEAASVVFISHGGYGAAAAIDVLRYLGEHLAAEGFVAINIGHTQSTSHAEHRDDRPRDVSFMLDALASGALTLPPEFGGTLVLDRVGVTGNSTGAYTSLALAGVDYPAGDYRDDRFAAVAPISPHGVGSSYKAYYNGPTDHSWLKVNVPTYSPIGELELDSVGASDETVEGWRLQGFENYPDTQDHLVSIIAGVGHRQLGSLAPEDVQKYLAVNLSAFFDVYLRDGETQPCSLGALDLPERRFVETRRRAASQGTKLAKCDSR